MFSLVFLVLLADELGTMTGEVVNSVTGGGVRKATVRFQLMGQRGAHEVLTDSAGKFSAVQMSPGEYRVSARATGYVDIEQGMVVKLAERGEKSGLVVKLVPQGVIAGWVVDEDGDPVMNARVLAVPFRRSVGMGGDNGEPVQTNDLGEFRLNRLRPGRYFVLAAASVSFASEDGPSPSAARVERRAEEWTYHPAAMDMESATPLRVTAGGEMRGVEIRLRRSRALRLAGRLEGFPVGGFAWLRLRSGKASAALFDEGERTATVVGADGRFEFLKLPPREYAVFVEAVGSKLDDVSPRGHASVRLDGADVTGLVVRPDVMVRMTGTVNGLTEQKSALVTLKPEMDRYDEASKNVGADGRFAMVVAQGTYRVELSHMANRDQYLEAAEFGGKDVLKDGLELASAGDLILTVGQHGGMVAGAVESPEALRQTWVLLWPGGDDRTQRHRYKIEEVKRDGTFEIRGVAPGHYRMIAIQPPEADRSALFGAGYLKLLESKAEEVEVAAGGRVTKDLKVAALSEFE